MQVNRFVRMGVLSLGWLLVFAAPSSALEITDAPVLSSLLRTFTDSDKVSVRSLSGDYAWPLANQTEVSMHWNNERVVIPGISAPVGSAEAVDAVTTASRPIAGNAYQDFVKVRNEMEGTLARGPASLEYYLSTENDYLAQQLGAKYGFDLEQRQLNLALGTSYGWDDIEPLADDDTHTGPARRTTLHWDAVATRILSPTTLLRVGLEYNIVDGLQHNPYRNVYAGGTRVPERHPSHRERRDTFVKFNQYFQNRSSVKLHYRFYNDDWGITSHETGTKLSQYLTHALSVQYEYRYYRQSSADFYRAEYATVDGVDGYRTGDYRMDALASHLFASSLRYDLDGLAKRHPMLGRVALWLDYERYVNSNNYSANILETGLDFRFE